MQMATKIPLLKLSLTNCELSCSQRDATVNQSYLCTSGSTVQQSTAVQAMFKFFRNLFFVIKTCVLSGKSIAGSKKKSNPILCVLFCRLLCFLFRTATFIASAVSLADQTTSASSSKDKDPFFWLKLISSVVSDPICDDQPLERQKM